MGDEKLLTIRFDCDTELCLREGMPRLLELAEALDVRFSFFVNPGRAIRRRDLFARRARGLKPGAAKLSLLEKLGTKEACRLFLANPALLPRHRYKLERALAGGHDVGLHGGRNHGEWARRARQWPAARIARELDFGLEAFRRSGLVRPELFASPGWTSPPGLGALLAERGFRVLADRHGTVGHPAWSREGLLDVPTAICGEPGGVGYLEYLRARGLTDGAALRHFSRRLAACERYACLYDHPFYAGRQGTDLLENLIRAARDDGWAIRPMSRASVLIAGSPETPP